MIDQKQLFMKGFTYGYDGRRGMYRMPEAAQSRERLATLGGDWAALAFVVTQDSFCSTCIRPDYRFTVTDKDIIAAVSHLHSLGLKVCMKPMVNCMDGVWRARISFPEPEWGDKDYWGEWFSSYTAFLCHYAEDTGCEMFCVGCEMLGTEHKEEHWRNAVEAVRKIYHGSLVYNTNHGKEQSVTWWDAVDYIGTSAYYRVAKEPGASVESMLAEWDRHKKSLAALSKELGKRIIFMEIGCRSARGLRRRRAGEFLRILLPIPVG